MRALVYIATSLDGYIADREGGVDWLHAVPNPEGSDFGFGQFMASVDALLMGRNTFETVLGFDVPWPYDKPVYVASERLTAVPEALEGRAFLVRGSPAQLLEQLAEQGHGRVYVDGGRLIQSFLAADLIDELVLTRVPVLLGGGTPLFAKLERALAWSHLDTTVHAGQLVMSRYRRARAES